MPPKQPAPPKRRNAVSDAGELIRAELQKKTEDKVWDRQNRLMGLKSIPGSTADGLVYMPGQQGASDYIRHLGALGSIEARARAAAKDVSVNAISRGVANIMSSASAKAEGKDDGKGLVRSNRWLEHLKEFHSQNPHLTYKQAMGEAKHSYFR